MLRTVYLKTITSDFDLPTNCKCLTQFISNSMFKHHVCIPYILYIYTCISFSILLSLFPRSSRSHGKIESKMGGPKLQLIKITYDSLRNVRPHKIDPHLPTSWRNLQSTLLTSMSFKLRKGISSLSTLSSSKNKKLKVRTCLRRNGS